MARIRSASELTPAVTVGDTTVTARSQAITVDSPFGQFVWNRPTAVVVQREGHTSQQMLVDVTRVLQIGFYGLAVVFLLVSVAAGRPRSRGSTKARVNDYFQEERPVNVIETLINSSDKTQEQLVELMQGIFAAARTGVVYSDPVQVGEYTAITASEVISGGGFGFGKGFGAAPKLDDEISTEEGDAGTGGGGGGGGGGGSSSRPVAVILVGADGVKIQPIVDVTKVGLAALTMCAVVIPMLVRLARAGGR